MNTINTYTEDESALGRLNTWTMLYNIAVDRPFVGGGFEPYSQEVFRRYFPDYERTHSAHSIYFQVLGEHGFVGFALFALFWILTWRLARRIVKHTRNVAGSKWAYWLAVMIQVSLVGYFVGGTFLNLAYWDMPYFLMIVLVITWHAVRNESTEPAKLVCSTERETASGSPAGHLFLIANTAVPGVSTWPTSAVVRMIALVSRQRAATQACRRARSCRNDRGIRSRAAQESRATDRS